MKTLKDARDYTQEIKEGSVKLYLTDERIENEPVNITPYYDKEKHCIALPLVVSLGNTVVACRMKLAREVILECLNDKN